MTIALRVRIAAVGGLALGLAACAAGPAETPAAVAQGGRQCIFARTVDGFQSVSPDAVNLRVGVGDVYHVTLFAPCQDLPFATGIALRTKGGGTTICSPLDAELIVPGPIGPQRCPLSDIRKLTAAEVAALPARERP